MDPIYLGFIGVIIGSLITLIISCITFKKEIMLWKLQFKSQRTEKMQILKMEKYANFLGAYFYLEGSIGDIIDILENNKEDAVERLTKIAYEPDFEKSIVTINNEKGWVLLLSKEPGIVYKLSEMENIYDEIQTSISKVRSSDTTIESAQSIVQGKQKILKEISKTIIELMKQDMICD